MDSDADSSNFLPLPTIDSVENKSKKGRIPIAQITWAYTCPACKGETQFHKGQSIQYCIYYTESLYGTSVTTNIQNHLKSKHQISIDSTPSTLQQAIIN